MNNFTLRKTQGNELKALKVAIEDLLQKMNNLTFSDSEEALEDLEKIKVGLEIVQSSLNGLRRQSTRIMGFSRKLRTDRSSEFESELGRVSNLRNEFSLLQNQLTRLKNSLPGLQNMIVNSINSSANIGQRTLDHLNEIRQKSEFKTTFSNLVSVAPRDAVVENLKPQIPGGGDIMFAISTLAALIFSFIRKSKP
ncbi:hypothetical protein BH23BAC1_BH23BAC1_25320 [soil metagenome]